MDCHGPSLYVTELKFGLRIHLSPALTKSFKSGSAPTPLDKDSQRVKASRSVEWSSEEARDKKAVNSLDQL